MSVLRVYLLTQSSYFAEAVRGLKVFRRCILLLGVVLKVEKNWINPAFSTGGIRTRNTRIRSTVALPTKLQGLAKQIVAGFVILYLVNCGEESM